MLQDLFAGSVADAAARRVLVSTESLESKIEQLQPPLNAFELLNAGNNVSVIAEIKRASPSKGFLAEIPSASELAAVYQNAGASAISVLTEQRKFLGSLDDLVSVTNFVDVPVLRKDFIANEYQILEARANGADIVLLIVAGLTQPQLEHLYGFAVSLGLSVLVETHTKDEVQRAMETGAKIIGINARDLNTFETDLSLFGRLIELLPADVIAIAESAVRHVGDVVNYAEGGATCVLVGEALVKGDPTRLIPEFAAVPKTRIV